MSSGPGIYVGNDGNQKKRDAQAYYGYCYSEAIQKLRQKTFDSSERGVPIEWFIWERVIVDECHESLVTGSKQEVNSAEFAQKARRGAREFLGVAQTDVNKRPLVAASGVWGLTGTPLLETEDRVTELANLMGGTYVTGAAHHWRKEERESGRDLFLNLSEGTRSREYRCAVQDSCDSYVKVACQRNRGEKLNVELHRTKRSVKMTAEEGKAFLAETSAVQLESFTITPDQLGEKAAVVLAVSASSTARHAALLETIYSILECEPGTKIIVFANASFGGYACALKALKGSDKTFCHVSSNHTVQEQNEIISWFRHVDATDKDRARPRVLLLSFEQAAGHNLQEACHNVIIFDPMYSGADAVADASVEEQAIGRVMRQGQKHDVTVTRIVLKGPNGERSLDDWIVERNLDPDTLAAATSNFD
jgi:Helicase conserved C-terminal domain